MTSRRWLFAEILARAPRDGIHESDTLKGHPFSSKLISLRSTVPWTSLNEGDIALMRVVCTSPTPSPWMPGLTRDELPMHGGNWLVTSLYLAIGISKSYSDTKFDFFPARCRKKQNKMTIDIDRVGTYRYIGFPISISHPYVTS